MHFINTISSVLSSFVLPTGATSTDIHRQVTKFVTDDLYLLIQKAVLSGEYYDSHIVNALGTIRGSIETLELNIATAINQLETEAGATNHTMVPMIRRQSRELTKLLKKYRQKYLDRFLELSRGVQNNLDFLTSGRDGIIADTRLLKSYTLKNELAETIATENSKKEIFNDSLFELNILLAYMDEYLECNDETISELNSIQTYLNPELRNDQNGEIFDLITQKRDFIEFKVNLRNLKRTNSAALQFPSLDNNNAYQLLLEKLRLHYNEIDSKKASELEQKIKGYATPLNDKITLEEVHHLNRYYKKTASRDDKRDRIKRISELFTKLSSLKGFEAENLFNQIAFKSINNLLQNSKLDLYLQIEVESKYKYIKEEFQKYISGETNNASSKFLNSQLEFLTKIQGSEYLTDYYCFYLFLDFLQGLITHLQLSSNELIALEKKTLNDDKIKEAKKRAFLIVEYLQHTYSKVDNLMCGNLRKMMSHEVKPAYLTHTECFVPYKWADGNDGRLFLDSSYILPNDFITLKARISLLETTLNASIIFLKNTFEMAVNEYFIDYKKTEFENKVKENEIKIVQIVAMFVSIATFVLINVKIFDNKTGLESFGIILGLAACFFIFNLFFYFIILSQLKQSKKAWKFIAKASWFLVIPLIFSVASFFILRSEGGKTSGEIKAIKEKIRIDSIETRRLFDTP